MKMLDFAPFTVRTLKNATCSRDHFAQEITTFPNICNEIMHHLMLRLIGCLSLVAIKLSNYRNTLYIVTHRMSFHSLKQSLLYLMHDHGILSFIVVGFRQLRAKILSNSWLQDKLVNSIFFLDRFLKNRPASMQDKKNTVILKCFVYHF